MLTIPPDQYIPEAGYYDECMDEGMNPRTHWQQINANLKNLGLPELAERRAEAGKLIRENGITYNVYGDSGGESRPWELDILPFVFDAAEWKKTEAGLAQRALLFDLILKDIYGPQRLIKEGLLPPEVIFPHRSFLHHCVGQKTRMPHHLPFYAADIARSPDGNMWVISDRTQAPSGMGYALENRIVMNRVLPELSSGLKVKKLADYYRHFREMLTGLSPRLTDSPNVVVMTPGPFNETYFEHAYLASYMGFPLVMGDDLTVRKGSVKLKTLNGPEQVDVILRRVDDVFCDPLELREDSKLGVAGLLHASYTGAVGMANPLGCGILENPGIKAFLSNISHYFLGTDLLLPTVATWWCGHKTAMNFLIDNLDTLVIKCLDRYTGPHAVLGGMLSLEEKNALVASIKARPYFYVGQEQVRFSSSPSFINNSLQPRNAVIRCYAASRSTGDYMVMPGGLTRTGNEKGHFIVSNQAGGISKDTWVLADDSEQVSPVRVTTGDFKVNAIVYGSLPSRTAENLFWVGRYGERTVYTSRMLRVISKYLSGANPGYEENEMQARKKLLQSLTHLTGTYPGFLEPENADLLFNNPFEEVVAVCADPTRPGSLVHNLNSFLNSAYNVRDRWSRDTWHAIDKIEGVKNQLLVSDNITNVRRLQAATDQLTGHLASFNGLNIESMAREEGWHILDAGRRLEQSLMLISELRSLLVPVLDAEVEQMLMEDILNCNESLRTYRFRYRHSPRLEEVLDILIFDKSNPGSLAYKCFKLQEHLDSLPKSKDPLRPREDQVRLLEVLTSILLGRSEQLVGVKKKKAVRKDLDNYLAHLSGLIVGVSDALNRRFFRHATDSKQLTETLAPEA